jgi:hypothetical protein
MSKEYGWTALAVYLGLSALDFPFCFLAVRMIGTETIGRWEHNVKEFVLGFVPEGFRGKRETTELEKLAIEDGAPRRVLEVEGEGEVIDDHGYKDAERANRGDNASESSTRVLYIMCHMLTKGDRYLHPARPGLRRAQILHLHPGASDSRYPPQSREDT